MREAGNGSYYARMGIWGEPTGITPQTVPSVLDTAFNRMGSVQNMFGKQYDNIIKKYQAQDANLTNQYNQNTLQGRIGAENTKNQTDMQYYPQIQAAKLAQDQQTIKEIMSRTGLNYAQAQEAGARTGLIGVQTQDARNHLDPNYDVTSAYNAYNNAPAGSPQKSIYAAHLASMIAGKSGGAGGQPSPLITGALTQILPGFGNAASGFIKDPRFGSSRSGAGGTYVDQGTGQVVSTDTSTQSSRDQRTIAGSDNMQAYLNKLTTLPQYSTLKDQASLGAQKLSNYVMGSNYDAPSKQAEAEAAITSSAEGFINSFGLNATNENVNKAADIMRRKTGESNQGYKQRLQNQLSDFVAQERRAKDRLASGTDVTPKGLGAADIDRLASETGIPRDEVLKRLRNR